MRGAFLGFALALAFACGVNAATRHWTDAVANAVSVGLALFLRHYWPETRDAVTSAWRRIAG